MSSKRHSRSGHGRSSQDEEVAHAKPESSKRTKERPSTSQEAMEVDDYEPGSWECTVCTFRNKYEAFKCEICESRKGTSTRKPRLNQSVVQQQTLVHNLATQPPNRKTRLLEGRSRFSPESTGSGQNSRGGVGSARSSPVPSRAGKKKRSKQVQRILVPLPDELVNKSSPVKRSVTVNNATFTILEFKLREKTKRRSRSKKHRREREEANDD